MIPFERPIRTSWRANLVAVCFAAAAGTLSFRTVVGAMANDGNETDPTFLLGGGSNADQADAVDTCVTPPTEHQKQQQHQHQHQHQQQQQQPEKRRTPGTLRPVDVPSPDIFSAYDRDENDAIASRVVALPGKDSQLLHTGSIQQINRLNSSSPASIAMLPQLVDLESVENVLTLLRSYHSYDQDPDTVDGMTTYEIFVDSPDLGGTESMKVLDTDPNALPERNRLRTALRAILHPILDERITPFVRQHYSHVCHNNDSSTGRIHPNTTPRGSTPSKGNRPSAAATEYQDRSCTPCYSLIRRYRHNERQSHGTHHDGHALITVVVSLSNYGSDYLGGLYVSTGYGQRQFLNLSAGDAVAHQSTLLHGVQVLDVPEHPTRTERWSWILWYRDSATCHDFSYEWFQDCADEGDAVCQELHATKVGHISHLSESKRALLVLELNRDAAEQGNGNAAIKMARAYLKLLPSHVPRNVTEAARYYRLAIASQHPDGHYGMANLYLLKLQAKTATTTTTETSANQTKTLTKVIWHLEEAARLNHAFAMFNLGIAHVYGYGTPGNRIDTDLAATWLVQSGLPEGYYVASHQAASVQDSVRQKQYDDRARTLGFYQPWRKYARQQTGSGGAGGVDLNMPWPIARDGRRPPVF